MNAQFIAAITQIADEKNLPRETIIDAVEAALAAAFKKDYGDKDQEVRVKLNEDTGAIRVFVSKEVVKTEAEVENPELQMPLAEAKKIDKDAKVGTEEEPLMVEYEVDPGEGFGRVA